MESVVFTDQSSYETDYIDLMKQSTGLDGDILIDGVKIKNVHTTLIGIINFSSSHSSSCKKKGFMLKKFSPFFSKLENVWVRTNKITQTSDIYAKVVIDWDKSTQSKIECYVDEYMDKVSCFENEKTVIEKLTTSHWSSKVNKLIESVGDFDTCGDRVDFTNTPAYSIDPKGCVDIDDALHFKVIDNNYFEIGIHIADVTSYFPIDSPVWNEMSNRVETVYLPNAIHMYPSVFSTNKASLREGKISRTFTLVVTLDKNYNIVSRKFCKGIVTVTNMTYDEADLSDDENIKHLFSAAKKMCIELLGKECISSHELVETFMVLTNNEAAKYIIESAFYKEKIIKGLIRVQNCSDIKQLPKGLLDDNTYEQVKHLRTQRAIYKYHSETSSNRHNGLNLDMYTHFTSPIRRYADVLIHQIINAIIENNVSLLPKINAEMIFKLNFYRSYYKKCIIYNNEIELVSNFESSYEDMSCIIIDIHKNKCRVLANHEDKNFIFDVDIFYKKITEALNIENTDDGVIISANNKKNIQLTIGQTVTIRVCYIPLKLKKVKSYIIEPNVYDCLFI